MRKILCFLVAVIMLTLLSGCFKDTATAPPDSSAQSIPLLTEEEARAIAGARYPDGVTLTFEKLEEIDEKNCFVFIVNRDSDNLLVNRAAVSASDGKVWIMGANRDNWVTEMFFGDLTAPQDDYVPNAYYEITMPDENNDNLFEMYFSNDRGLPAGLSPRNDGKALLDEANVSIIINITKVTGTGISSPEGPAIYYSVSWESGTPVLDRISETPAPLYENPRDVLKSREEPQIDDESLIEAAERLRQVIADIKAGKQIQ